MGTRGASSSGGKGGPRIVARRTGRPARRTPAAVAAARRLKQAQFSQQAQFTDDQVAMLDRIAAGRPPRNALAILRAMELKAAYAYEKPKQAVEHSGSVRYELVDPFAKKGAAGE